MYKVLIVEDDFVIASSMKDFLAGWGLEAEYLREFGHVLESFLEYQPHEASSGCSMTGRSSTWVYPISFTYSASLTAISR